MKNEMQNVKEPKVIGYIDGMYKGYTGEMVHYSYRIFDSDDVLTVLRMITQELEKHSDVTQIVTFYDPLYRHYAQILTNLKL
jgi:hypothetical protein